MYQLVFWLPLVVKRMKHWFKFDAEVNPGSNNDISFRRCSCFYSCDILRGVLLLWKGVTEGLLINDKLPKKKSWQFEMVVLTHTEGPFCRGLQFTFSLSVQVCLKDVYSFLYFITF